MAQRPIWKVRRLRILTMRRAVQMWKSLETFLFQEIKYTRKLEIIQSLFLMGGIAFLIRPPLPGIAVAIIGLIGLFMVVRAEERWGRSEKILWIVIAILFFLVEIKAIERNEQNHRT